MISINYLENKVEKIQERKQKNKRKKGNFIKFELFCFQDDNDWGTSDWGDNSLSTKSIDTEDEKKKQREEKRLQRQKEIEAKRAAKKGPMKLGAKKQPQADPDLF